MGSVMIRPPSLPCHEHWRHAGKHCEIVVIRAEPRAQRLIRGSPTKRGSQLSRRTGKVRASALRQGDRPPFSSRREPSVVSAQTSRSKGVVQHGTGEGAYFPGPRALVQDYIVVKPRRVSL